MKNIKRDRYGWRVYAKINGHQDEQRFPPDASLKTMKAALDDLRVQLRKLPPKRGTRGSLQADIERYLSQVASMATYAQRAEHLILWRDALGSQVRRHKITAGQIRAVLHGWRKTLSAATCNKRRTALMHLWSVLDGRGATNPVRDVPKFRVDDAIPRGRDLYEMDAKLLTAPRCRSRATCRTLLWTGMRPAELARAVESDVDLERRTVVVRTAKGGRVRLVPLTDQGVTAWQEFASDVGWDLKARRVPQAAPLNRWLKTVCGPGVRVYDLRHSYGTALARLRTRLDVIAALMGHSTLNLTRGYVLAAVELDALTATSALGSAGSPAGSAKTANNDRVKSA